MKSISPQHTILAYVYFETVIFTYPKILMKQQYFIFLTFYTNLWNTLTTYLHEKRKGISAQYIIGLMLTSSIIAYLSAPWHLFGPRHLFYSLGQKIQQSRHAFEPSILLSPVIYGNCKIITHILEHLEISQYTTHILGTHLIHMGWYLNQNACHLYCAYKYYTYFWHCIHISALMYIRTHICKHLLHTFVLVLVSDFISIAIDNIGSLLVSLSPLNNIQDGAGPTTGNSWEYNNFSTSSEFPSPTQE